MIRRMARENPEAPRRWDPAFAEASGRTLADAIPPQSQLSKQRFEPGVMTARWMSGFGVVLGTGYVYALVHCHELRKSRHASGANAETTPMPQAIASHRFERPSEIGDLHLSELEDRRRPGPSTRSPQVAWISNRRATLHPYRNPPECSLDSSTMARLRAGSPLKPQLALLPGPED
jgi:hypothetical protein